LPRSQQRGPDPAVTGALEVRPMVERARRCGWWITTREAGQAGQGLAEYALILALIAIVAIVALIFLGSQISSILSDIGNNI
jgi:Flp pilus assembly pilin Flp